jgi:iron-sulfur cluster assembly accessory protein
MLQVTDLALEKIKEVLSEEGQKETPLRVIAIPGGNGSVQYMLTLEQENQPDDIALDRGGVKFLVDSDSVPYLEKATIDFIDEMTRVGFTITNPDYPAAGGCGAGCACGNGGCGCGGSN